MLVPIRLVAMNCYRFVKSPNKRLSPSVAMARRRSSLARVEVHGENLRRMVDWIEQVTEEQYRR